MGQDENDNLWVSHIEHKALDEWLRLDSGLVVAFQVGWK